MASKVPDDDFDAGFEVGYQLIRGTMVMTPVAPVGPLAPLNSTDFLEGIKAGIRAAGYELRRR
jgi:hypothetical protein